MIIDCAVYRDGVRETTEHDSESLDAALSRLGEDDFLWVGIGNPTADEMQRVGDSLGLHPLAVEDALEAHQRPKVEKYSDHTFISIRTVSYSDDDITTHEVNIFLGEKFLLTVRHGGPTLRNARKAAEGMIEPLSHGPTAALYAVVDSIVDHYEEVAAELETDVQEVETSVFGAERTNDSSRIYRLKRETLEFRRAVLPLREPIHRLALATAPEDARPYFRDIADHLARAAEAIDSIDHLLDNALQAHLAQLSVQQNEDMRKLTAGATIFAVPTAIAGVYGMNFEHMPELSWTYGYPMCLAVIAGLCGYIYRRFKKSGWL
ncbi:magnesium/cobalt transporter CorA [Aeromicrobium endophyticum]|uniref:Magnesium transport protein CorA n=1 Tax=Aeromicrobium endophyticum TaxID=2292704 RepID=A0A371P517_9ACTN|nr:magnesium/cobalt transporter CorA [Aeromicrobium endophyticum]REK71043.1 magnesium and cobalt transport protein CorA [Aeromicrobium endophyticum]